MLIELHVGTFKVRLCDGLICVEVVWECKALKKEVNLEALNTDCSDTAHFGEVEIEDRGYFEIH